MMFWGQSRWGRMSLLAFYFNQAVLRRPRPGRRVLNSTSRSIVVIVWFSTLKGVSPSAAANPALAEAKLHLLCSGLAASFNYSDQITNLLFYTRLPRKEIVEGFQPKKSEWATNQQRSQPNQPGPYRPALRPS